MSSSLAARQASKGAGPDRSADDPVVARRATIAVVAAGAVAAFLAFWFAAHRELWLDEYYTALMADLPFREMTRFLRGDVHPPLYYVSISGWQRLFGDSQLALRGFSILMHLASGAVFYRFLREATGRAYLAAMGGVLFLLSPALLFYATEARMYSLGVLLANSFLWLAWRQVTGTGGTGEAVLLGVLAALAFYTHYFTLFVSAGLFIFWGGVLVRRKASPTPWLSAAGTAVLLTAPWVPVVLRQRLGKHALDAALIASWADPDALTYMPGGGPPMREQHPIPLIVENLASLTGLYPADALPVMGLLAIPFAVVLAFAALRTLRGERGGWFVVVLAVANVAG